MSHLFVGFSLYYIQENTERLDIRISHYTFSLEFYMIRLIRNHFLADLKILKEDLSALSVSLLELNHDVNLVMKFLAVKMIYFILSLWKNLIVSSVNSRNLSNN